MYILRKTGYRAVCDPSSYARSQTVARISDEHLAAVAEAGLNRIHIGPESGCDRVLELVKKGVDKKTHIEGGRKVRKAGMELSEDYIPGLGGMEYSRYAEPNQPLLYQNQDIVRFKPHSAC